MTRKPRRWLRWLGGAAIAVGAGAGILVVDAWSALGRRPSSEYQQRFAASAQFSGGVFRNPLDEHMDWMLALRRWWNASPQSRPEAPLPVVRRTAADFDRPPEGGLRVTWLGHSTMLIEQDGQVFLTDPVWGERAAPSSWLGPRRFHEPPLALADLPKLDAVLISHDHYDHLDYPTVAELKKRQVTWVVPLGVGSHLQYWDVPAEKIVELDWWNETQVGATRLVCTPSRHFSGRSITDRNATLWSSWAIVGPAHRVYFSGDTAMTPQFDEIGQKLGPFDIAMMESGAYNAAWADVHLGPEQAVRAHQMVRGNLMIPVHWGTFDLAAHVWTEPAERVLAAADKAGVRVVIPKPGDSVLPDDGRHTQSGESIRWWPELPWETAAQSPVVSSGLAEEESGARFLFRAKPARR